MTALKEWNKLARLVSILSIILYTLFGIIQYITPISNSYGSQFLDVNMDFVNLIGGIGFFALVVSLILTIIITIKSVKK